MATPSGSSAPGPKASVFVLTYNHAAWIGTAIDSALAQVAPFPIEILVADDCSTDGTREIVREYALRHPDRIRAFLPERNLGVAGIWLQAARRCRGEYVAILEGDDYWTSTEKLARQAALLDAHPGWTSCFHRATLFHEDGSMPPRPATPAFDRDVFDLDDLIRACFIPFLTVMFRRAALAAVPEWGFSYPWFDWLFHIACARQGPIGFLDEDMAAYRVHSHGNWSARDRIAQLEEDLSVYERLAAELPERRELIERCVENRHCQLAVEASGVPAETLVALVEPRADMPVYFNGREAAAVRLDGAASEGGTAMARLRALAARADVRPVALHYPPRGALREPAAGRRCALVVPRSADSALAEDGRLLAFLADGAELVWEDEWCRVWEADVDFPAGEAQAERGAVREMGALVEIAEVSRTEPLPAELRDCFLDEPKRGAVLDARVVDVLGWVLGSGARAVAVEFTIDGSVFWRAPLHAERPDLAEAFPDRPEAATAGFKTTLNLIGTPPEVQLDLRVVLDDQRRVPLGSIRGRHRWRQDRSAEFAQLVSVVIPCFGHAHYLGEAIESVLAQSYPHLEVLVIDDSSPDNVASIASRYPGVRCARGEGKGVSEARNLGLRGTNGDFLVFLDADDRLLPGAIEAGLRALEEHPECACAIGAYRRASHDGKPLRTHAQPPVAENQFAQLMRDNWAGFPARALYRRAVFEHVGGFDPELRAAEDFALNLEIARRFPIWSHSELVVEHREHGRNSSGDAALMLTETLAALRRQRPYAQRDRALRRAYRQGRRHWKEYYGGLLAVQAGESLRRRRWRKALGEVALLARHRPRALPGLLGSDRPTAT
jgi:glycosyltransferase involved in cell wall biosynthesis